MAQVDLKTLCTALGFALVIMQEKPRTKDDAARARALAGLIEGFCLTSRPDCASAMRKKPGGQTQVDKLQQLIGELSAVVTDSLERDHPDWSTEHDAEVALRHVREMGG